MLEKLCSRATVIAKKTRTKKWLAIIFAIALVVSWWFPLAGFVLLTSGVTMHLSFRASIFEKFVIAFILLVIGNALLYEIWNIIGWSPPITAIGILYAFIGWILLATASKRSDPLIQSADLICILVATVAFFLMAKPLFVPRGVQETHAETLLHLLTSGEDNASHFALFDYAYQHNGYAYRHAPATSGIIKDLINYPQTSEFTLGWLAKASIGSSFRNNTTILLYAYYGLASFFFGLMVYMICLAGTRLYMRLAGRLTLVGGVVLVLLATAFVTLGPLLETMGRGFQSQIMAYVFLAGLLYFLLLPRNAASRKQHLLCCVVLFAGICTSWWYLAPVAALPLMLYWYKDILQLWRHTYYILSLLAIGILGIYPIIISVLSSVTSSHLTQPGGIDVIAPVTIALYVIGALLVVGVTKKLRTYFVPLVWLLVTWAIFTALIGMYQKLSSGHFEYYYYKSFYTLIPLSMVVVLGVLTFAADIATVNLGKLQKIVVTVLLIASFVCALISLKPVYPQVYLNDWFNNTANPTQWSFLFNAPARQQYQDVVYVGGCANTGEAYLSNRFSGALLQSEGGWRSHFEYQALQRDDPGVISTLKSRQKHDEKLYVFMEPDCVDPSLANFLRHTTLANNVKGMPK